MFSAANAAAIQKSDVPRPCCGGIGIADPQRVMTAREKLKLIDELSRLVRELSEPAPTTARGSTAVAELLEIARALGVPTTDRRDDAPVFLEGTAKVETATWTQCGGLLFALAHDEVRDAQSLATRLAQRLFDLAPTHRRDS